ncbi:MAG: DUF5793 family protein [Halodesulfurarchaeum sp.]|nr:DUF5793 family protein [Halodesulfurarchaeum sp.]
MQRQEFSLTMRHVEPVSGAETAPLPTLRIQYDGPGSDLRTGLESADGNPLDESDVDVSLRFKGEPESVEAGVLGVSDRLTGDYICECNVDAERVLEFLDATKRRASTVDGPPKYRIQFVAGTTPVRTVEMDTFLVYGESGELRESESLLPNGVQL